MIRPTLRYALIFVILAPILMVTAISSQGLKITAFPQQYRDGNQTFGVISSIQNDESGKPAWLVSGHWTSTLLNSNSTNSNQTMGNGITPYSGSPFDAQIHMIRINGTGTHTHTITNFILANVTQLDNQTKVYNGTSTASMKEGPVTDIPTSIRITGDKVISIWIEPTSVGNHYGNTPIFGMVMDDKPRPSPLVRDTP